MKRNSLLVLPLCGLAVMLSLGMGCAKKADDATITSDIQSRFSQDSGLSNKQLSVQASNGVVTLSGTVEDDAQREAASRQAASEPGVREVINNLQVVTTFAAKRATAIAPKAKNTAQPSRLGSSKKSRRPKASADAMSDNSDDAGVGPGGMTGSNSASAQDAQNGAPAIQQVPPPPPPPKKVTIEQGTQLAVRLVDAIDSEKNQTGQTFHATLNNPLTADGEEVVPAGSDVVGHIAELKSAGKFAGQSEVVLQLDSITSGGQTYNIQTDQYKKQGSSRGKNTAEKVGGGAALGAIIGAIAGGGKGAGIGAAAGGGIGGGVQAATKGQQIKLPSETVLNFTLQAPVTMIKAPNPNADRQKLGNSQ